MFKGWATIFTEIFKPSIHFMFGEGHCMAMSTGVVLV